MTGDKDVVLDIYGNNAAVRCPSCSGVFVFSSHLNPKSGRPCPHCKKSIATIADEHISVSIVEQ
jgi:Zn finger protein HypA/HybF involved in hydrogenase expression